MTPRQPLLQKTNPFEAIGEAPYSGVSPYRVEIRCSGVGRYAGRVARDLFDVADDARDAVWQLMGRIGPRTT